MQKQFPIPKLNSENLQPKNALIIFVKNPELGKVKTRLAKTIGDKKALAIYYDLLAHTQKTTEKLPVEKHLYYSDFVDQNDEWANEIYHKKIQRKEADLGLKMAFAFKDMIDQNHQKVIIIGSDCMELTAEILQNSFSKLIDNEVVIGPANDGGYYLIGFDFGKLGERCGVALQNFFLEKQWSHSGVCDDAIEACKSMNLRLDFLPNLNDIDEEKDLKI